MLLSLALNTFHTLGIMCAPAKPALPAGFLVQAIMLRLEIGRHGVLCKAQADLPLPRCPRPGPENGRPRSRNEVSLREHKRSCPQLCQRGCLVSHRPHPSASARAACVFRSFAGLDVYGLAAGLATSWAVLVASRPAMQKKDLAYDLLQNCAFVMQKVRLGAHALRHSALHRLLLTELRTRVGARALGRGQRVRRVGRGW